MTPTETQQLKALLVATAMYYGQDFPDPVLKLFIEDLTDLPFADVARALRELRRNSKVTRFPLPAQIRGYLHPEMDNSNMPVLISNQIWDAIGKFGWPNHLKAKAHLGEQAWQIVEAAGGWLSLCHESDSNNPVGFKSNLRELAKSILAYAKAGRSGTDSRLPVHENREQIIAVSNLLQLPKMPGGAA